MAAKYNEDEMKSIMASYWRYEQQCPFVALEADWQLETWGDFWADLVAVDKDLLLIETEVKVSLADLRKDKEKNKHNRISRVIQGGNIDKLWTHYLYYAVPGEIANEAKLIVDELYPYAGLLGVNGSYQRIQSYKRPRPITTRPLTLHMLYRMSLCQSATLCRLVKDVAEARRVNINRENANQELREQLRLHQSGGKNKVELFISEGISCDHCPLLQRSPGSDRYSCGYSKEELIQDTNFWMVKRGKNCPNKSKF